MTYDKGYVRLYFDGTEVGKGSVGQDVGSGGPVFSYYDLRVGNDWAGTGPQQLAGYVDDILILQQALKKEDIEVLYKQGAERYLAHAEETAIAAEATNTR